MLKFRLTLNKVFPNSRYNFLLNTLLPMNKVVNVVKITTDIELIGMSIAATKGESLPATAKLSPIML